MDNLILQLIGGFIAVTLSAMLVFLRQMSTRMYEFNTKFSNFLGMAQEKFKVVEDHETRIRDLEKED